MTGKTYKNGVPISTILLFNKSLPTRSSSTQLSNQRIITNSINGGKAVEVAVTPGSPPNDGGCYDIFYGNDTDGWIYLYTVGNCGGGTGGVGIIGSSGSPNSNGSLGVNNIGSDLPLNQLGNRPIAEYKSPCAGALNIWNASVASGKETVGVITSDGKMMFVAELQEEGGTWSGPYNYEGSTYYVYPAAQGAPNQTYTGMVSNQGIIYIPIVAIFHTHTPCLNDGNNGISNIIISNGDRQMAVQFPNATEYIIGCNAIGTFNKSISVNGSPTLIASGSLGSACHVLTGN